MRLTDKPSFKILWESSVEAFEEFAKNGFISSETEIKIFHAAVYEPEATGVCRIIARSLAPAGISPEFKIGDSVLMLLSADNVDTYRELEKQYDAMKKLNKSMINPERLTEASITPEIKDFLGLTQRDVELLTQLNEMDKRKFKNKNQ